MVDSATVLLMAGDRSGARAQFEAALAANPISRAPTARSASSISRIDAWPIPPRTGNPQSPPIRVSSRRSSASRCRSHGPGERPRRERHSSSSSPTRRAHDSRDGHRPRTWAADDAPISEPRTAAANSGSQPTDREGTGTADSGPRKRLSNQRRYNRIILSENRNVADARLFPVASVSLAAALALATMQMAAQPTPRPTTREKNRIQWRPSIASLPLPKPAFARTSCTAPRVRLPARPVRQVGSSSGSCTSPPGATPRRGMRSVRPRHRGRSDAALPGARARGPAAGEIRGGGDDPDPACRSAPGDSGMHVSSPRPRSQTVSSRRHSRHSKKRITANPNDRELTFALASGYLQVRQGRCVSPIIRRVDQASRDRRPTS